MHVKNLFFGLVIATPTVLFAQNVGIGTTTPVSPLTVISSGSNPTIGKGIIQKSGAVEIGFFASSNGLAFLQTWSNHNLLFATNNQSAAMTLTTGNNVGIGIPAPENKLHVVGAATSSNNATVYAENTASIGSAVYGFSNNAGTNGVTGLSGSGNGVYAYSGSARGVSAVSPLGSALYGNSLQGYALEVLGKVKISGGNTNPSAGAVLTSLDANGNAVWQKPQNVAFKVFGVSSDQDELPENSARRIQYGSEAFDMGNNYALLASGATPTSNSSVFTAPVDGIYHFDVGCSIFQSNFNALFNDIEFGTLSLMRNRNGVETTLVWVSGKRTFRTVGGSEVSDKATFNISVAESLKAGDRIYVNIIQSSGTDIKINGDESNWFSGVLVTPL